MTNRRQVIIAVAVALIFAGGVFADMMPVSEPVAGSMWDTCDFGRSECHEARLSGLFSCNFSAIDLSSSLTETFPKLKTGTAETSVARHRPDLTERSGSLDYCLYALLGLGVCRSGHWVRKSSLDFVPDWYHNGGPFQIGHSLAVSPEILCPAPAYCFVQPDSTVGGSVAPSRPDDTASLWWKSQFAPTVLAARPPPAL